MHAIAYPFLFYGKNQHFSFDGISTDRNIKVRVFKKITKRGSLSALNESKRERKKGEKAKNYPISVIKRR